jgi:magnesium transporter
VPTHPPRGPLDLLRRRPFDEPDPRRGSASPLVGSGVYVDGKRVEPATEAAAIGLDGLAALRDCARERGGFVWLGLFEPSEADLAAVARVFGLHPLAVEDAAHPMLITERPTLRQRPKLELYGDALFLVLKTCVYIEHTELTDTAEIVDSGDLMVFCGQDYVVTVRHGRHLAMGRLRDRLEADPDALALGPAVVMHALADHVVDVYLEVAEEMQTDLDELENAVFSARDVQQIDNAYHLKRELLELRAAVLPLTAPLRRLSETEFAVVPDQVRVYFRDVLDHLDRVRDALSSLDELLSSITQACVARVGAIQNEDNRRISAWVAIAAVPTVIAGIYGMNFRVMPELTWRYSYPIVLLVMLSVCSTLYVTFKRKGWL